MDQITQSWFDMKDLRRSRLASASWLPLRSQRELEAGQWMKFGYSEEYVGHVAIILPTEARDQALQLEWGDADCHDHKPWLEGGRYFPGGTFPDFGLALVGNYPILVQSLDGEDSTEWHLEQDLLLALRLKREGDVWVCPAEDYIEVVRLKRAGNGAPELIEIRSEQFRDYLCARNSGLLVATYHSRRAIFEESPNFTWGSCNPKENVEGGQWEGMIKYIDESGLPCGSGIRVSVARRIDPELGDDIPVLGSPSNENTESSSGTIPESGQRFVLISGEMWRNEWVEPGPLSPRVCRDQVEPSIPFIIANDGSTATAKELKGPIRWLWFSPSIVSEVLKKRGGSIGWYTEDTGSITLLSHSGLHFGINGEGLLNVFAKDIGMLPEAVQKLWVAHNVSPEGGVSEELLASQMKCNPASTLAPEVEFKQAMQDLEESSTECFGKSLLRTHESEKLIISSVHRFQCLDFAGVCHLCKEITKVVTERIDIDLLKKIRPDDDKNLRSLKRLERLLSGYGEDGSQILSPLVGAYELRLADAHLPSSDLSSALKLLQVQDDGKYIKMGKQIIRNVSLVLTQVSSIFRARKVSK